MFQFRCFFKFRLKWRRWHDILKTRDATIVSIGWRRFQTMPVYAIRKLLYVVLHAAVHSTTHALPCHFLGLSRPSSDLGGCCSEFIQQSGLSLFLFLSTCRKKKKKKKNLDLEMQISVVFMLGIYFTSRIYIYFKGWREPGRVVNFTFCNKPTKHLSFCSSDCISDYSSCSCICIQPWNKDKVENQTAWLSLQDIWEKITYRDMFT